MQHCNPRNLWWSRLIPFETPLQRNVFRLHLLLSSTKRVEVCPGKHWVWWTGDYRLAPVLKTIFHQCVISYTCSQSYSDGSVLKQSHQSNTSYKLWGILSYQGLRLSNLTLGLTALIFSDWIRHKPKIVTINMFNHKAGQNKSINTRPPDKTAWLIYIKFSYLTTKIFV